MEKELISDELFDSIVNEIASGSSRTKAFAKFEISSNRFDKKVDSTPDCQAKYDRAQRTKAESLADDIIDIADEDVDPQRARNRIDARKWWASKGAQSKFGDIIDVNVNQTVDILGAIAEAKTKMLPGRYLENEEQIQLIDVTATSQDRETGQQPVVVTNPDENESVDPFE